MNKQNTILTDTDYFQIGDTVKYVKNGKYVISKITARAYSPFTGYLLANGKTISYMDLIIANDFSAIRIGDKVDYVFSTLDGVRQDGCHAQTVCDVDVLSFRAYDYGSRPICFDKLTGICYSHIDVSCALRYRSEK